MSTQLNPYLSFRGNAREAMEFYHSVFGGDLVLNRYDSIPGVMGDGDEGSKIMHGQLNTPNGLTLMGADMPDSMSDTPDVTAGGSSVCVWGDDDEQIRAYWTALSENAEIRVPFEKAPWGDTFGDLRDRFGVSWMFSLADGSAE